MPFGVDLVRPLCNGGVMLGEQKLIGGKNLKDSAKRGVAMGAATVGSEVAFRVLPLHGHLGPLEQYSKDIGSSALFAAIEAFYLSKDEKSFKKFLYDFMLAMGASVGGEYLEAPVYPMLPSFLK